MSGATAEAVLCIFARVPARGRVKRRLAAGIGEGAALEAYITLVEDTLTRLARVPRVAGELWVDDVPDDLCRRWARRWRLPLQGQRGGDLGARMNHALCAGLTAAPRALVVGTDCPDIDAGYVLAALDSLQGHDVVLGPAADGGYGLVGARRPVPELFDDVPWGTAEVLSATLAAAAESGLAVALLPEIHDVDDAADWQRYLDSAGCR